MVYVCQLPQSVQDEICKDAIEMIRDLLDSIYIDDLIADIMNEKLINIIGSDGLLSYEKYHQYLN